MSDSDAYDDRSNRGDDYDDGDDYNDRDDYDDKNVETNPAERGKWISMLVALLGLWMLVQAYALDPVAGNFWSDVIVGVALIALGGYNYYRRADERHGSVAVGAFVALLGLWLVVTPFILGSTEGAAAVETDLELYNDVAVGLLTFLLGAYSAYEARETHATTPTART